MTSKLSAHVDAMLLEHRREILVFATMVAEKHDARAYTYLMTKMPQNGVIKDGGTPANLKAKVAVPGALFNKRLRPTPLGSK